MSESASSPDVGAVKSEYEALWKEAERHWAAGEVNRVPPLYRRTYELIVGALGPDHILVAHAEYLRGCLFAAQEKWADAIAALRRADELAARNPAAEDVWRADILVRLADAIFNDRSCERDDRERCGFETLYTAITLLAPPTGPAGREYAVALDRLAHWQYWFGHYDDSRTTYIQALDEWARAPDPNRHSVAFAHLRLALIERERPAAEGYFQRYLTLCEDLHGPNHPEAAEAACRLADWYANAGRPAEAEPLFSRAWSIWEEHGLTASRDTEWMREMYDRFRTATGPGPTLALPEPPETPEAIMTSVSASMLGPAREKLARFERLLEADDPDLVELLTRVAIYSPDLSERVSLWERAIGILERHHGPDAVELIDPVTSLAATHRDAGNFHEAHAALDRADRIRHAAYGPDHLAHAASLELRSTLAEAQGELDEADRLRQAALATALRHAAEVGDYGLAEKRYRYTHFLRRRGWLPEAEAIIRIGIVDYERAGIFCASELADYYQLLADIVQALGRAEEAATAGARARELYGK